MDKDNDASNTDFSFTDIDLDPITCDTNPAHFDGFLYEIADYCKRTGKFLPLLQQGVTIRGHKTIVDSPAAVPFIQGGVTRAKDYDAFDPCPPTSQRLLDHKIRLFRKVWICYRCASPAPDHVSRVAPAYEYRSPDVEVAILP